MPVPDRSRRRRERRGGGLGPFSLCTDEQWHERPDWRDEFDPQRDGEQNLAPDVMVGLLAESTGRGWRHEEGPDGVVRFFELTDWNPQGQWQEYTIGERFPGLFHLAAGIDPACPELVRASDCPQERADGGPLRLLDLDAARREAQLVAAERYVRWTEITAGTPGVHALADFEAELGRSAAATQLFEAQPQVAVARAQRLVGKTEDPVVLFGDRDRLFEEAGLQAVTASALLTVDDVWVADPSGARHPGPRAPEALAYHREANAYLDGLDADCVVVLVSIVR
ncbi:hypothetical protein [Kitasatospora sp. NE20-6]|uniref:hypothetical protein n=1 Tax=Kitasatospora sp. NE20-6 TaxID=2859066 RepID=UPI0038B35DF3